MSRTDGFWYFFQEARMENPKTVVKTEPRKSLLVLFIMGLHGLIIGGIITFVSADGNTQMADGVGWILISVGVLCMLLYGWARRQTLNRKREQKPGEKY